MSDRDRRERNAFVALGALLGGSILFGIVLSLWSGYPLYQPRGDEGQQYEDARYHVWGDSWAQWAMAAFAVIATGVSWRALYLLRETFKETKRTADATVIDLRPWVDVEVVAGALALKEGRVYGEIKVVAKNIGRTPAMGCRITCGLIYSGDTMNLGALTDEFYDGALRRMSDPYAGVNILPGNTAGRELISHTAPMDIAEIVPSRVLIVACVTYRHSDGVIGQTGAVFSAESRREAEVQALTDFYPFDRLPWSIHFLGYESGRGCGRVT